MRNLFIAVLNMSLSASFVALAVTLLRLLLKKAPKVFSYALWAVVFFRLVCPFSFESAFSLLMLGPDTVPRDIVYAQNPVIESGGGFVDDTVNQVIQNTLPSVRPEASVNPMGIVVDIGSYIWLAGILLILGYSIFSYLRLWRRLACAALAEDSIYETDRVATPFVLGVLRPRIYLPLGLAGEERDYILRHERTHIRRGDHLIKPFGFLALTLHWFNPLIWLCYRLMCRDMEMSCDERVLGQYGEDIRAKYSGSLLSLSIKQSGLLAPLAFGEPDAKSRIKNVLNYKKPAFWISIVAVIVLIAAGFCLLANPRSKPAEEKNYAERLLQYRTEYVGDNAKVGGIVSTLEYPEKVEYQSFELYTGGSPLSVTVRLDTDTDTRNFYADTVNQDLFEKNAVLIFALVGNVENVNFELRDNVYDPFLIQYTRQQTENYIGGSLWAYSESLLSFESLILRLGNMPDTAYDLEQARAQAMLFETAETDLYAIGRAGFEHYYGFFMGEDVPKEYRILSYQVNGIALLAGDPQEFTAAIYYDHTTSGRYFMTANGSMEPTPDGGLICKESYLEIRIKRLDGNQYQIVDMGTGGAAQGLPPIKNYLYAGAVAIANEQKEEILAALRDEIQQYRDGKVVNNEVEPYFDPLPADARLPDLTSVDDFAIEAGNEMSPVQVTLDFGPYTADFYLSRVDVGAPEAEEKIIWAVNAVDIHPREELQYDFFTVPVMDAEQQSYYDGYLSRIIYTSLLMRDWNSTDYSALAVDPIDLGSTGSFLIMAFEDITGKDEMQRLFREYDSYFPADLIEGALLEYFPFTADQLHEILSYHYRADTNTYYYDGGRGGGPIEGAVTGIRAAGDFIYLDYEIFTGFSGMDEPPTTYLYKTPGVLTLRQKPDGSYLYYAVKVEEHEEAPPK